MRIQIDAQLLDIDGNLAQRLHAIGMKRHARFTGDLCDLGNRLDRAELVIGMHHRDQHGLRPQSAANIVAG